MIYTILRAAFTVLFFFLIKQNSNWILNNYPRFYVMLCYVMLCYVMFMFHPTLVQLSVCHEPVTLISANPKTKIVIHTDRRTVRQTIGYYNMSTNTQDKHERTHKGNSCPHMTRTTITQLLMCVGTTHKSLNNSFI